MVVHLSRASSIVLDKKQHWSIFYPPPPAVSRAGIHTHTSFRDDEACGCSPTWCHLLLSPAQTVLLALWLRDPDISCWSDAVFHIESMAFCPKRTEESQPVKKTALSSFLSNARRLSIISQAYFHTHELQAEACLDRERGRNHWILYLLHKNCLLSMFVCKFKFFI